MLILLPSEEYIREIHQIIIEEFDDEDGDLHPEIVSLALERAKQYINYEECNLHKVFAVVLDTLANKHPFIDGNKRTALVTVMSAYRLNGVDLSYEHLVKEDFVNLMLWVVDRKIEKDIDDIAEQLMILINKYATDGAKIALSTAEYQF